MEAILQPAKLFELLETFKLARRKSGKFQERVAPETVEA
jgi:hypothetical protein